MEATVSERTDAQTGQLMAVANRLLEFLVTKANRSWSTVMSETLTDKELDLNNKTLESKLAEFGLDTPFGAVVGGTGIAKDEAGLTGEDGQRAIQLLKQTGRLVQCGRGRGKCLVILNQIPLNGADQLVDLPVAQLERTDDEATTKPEAISRTDVPELLRTARDEWRALRRAHEEAQRQVRTLEAQLVDVRHDLTLKEAELAALNDKVRQAAVTTWA